MQLEYLTIFTDNIEDQLSFFKDKLGFETHETTNLFEGTSCHVLKTDNPGRLLMICGEMPGNDYKNMIVLHTDDCLKEYHRLKSAGVDFCTAPQYLPPGLGAEFSDPAGNRFLLLEIRNYRN